MLKCLNIGNYTTTYRRATPFFHTPHQAATRPRSEQAPAGARRKTSIIYMCVHCADHWC